MLAVGGAFIPVTNLYTNLLISKGKSNIYLWNTVVQGTTQLIVMYLLYPYGIRQMILVYVCINTAWLLIWHWLVWREIRLSFLAAARDVLSFGLIAGFVMAVTGLATSFLTSLWLLFPAKIILAASLYGLIMWVSGSVTFKESLNYLLKRKKTSAS